MIRRIRNWLIVLLVGAGVVLAVTRLGVVDSTASAVEESPVEDATQVEVDDLTVTVSATGTISPVQQVGLSFELTGPVAEVLVEEGQPVRAGDVLARLDVPGLESGVANAEVALDLQQIALDALTAPPRDVDIAVAEAAVTAARNAIYSAASTAPNNRQDEIARLQMEIAGNLRWQQQLQRDIALIPPEVPQVDLSVPGARAIMPPVASPDQIAQFEDSLEQADYELQIAQTNYDATLARGPDLGSLSSAQAQLINAQVQLDRLLNGPDEIDLQLAQIELANAQLAVEQAAASLAQAVLVAPFDGIISRNNLTPGELPPSNAPAIEIINLDEYYIDLAVDETDIVSVQAGQSVDLRLDALPESDITGVVTRVAQTPTRIGQVVTYVARVTLDPTLEPVRVGMNATATVVVNQLEDVLTLRNRFIRIDRATQQAYATIERSDGRFEEVPIELGLRNDTHSQVVAGLSAGQRVVLLPRDSFFSQFGGVQ